MSQSRKHVHMVGIGGIGMSGIAHILLKLGFVVSGSDLRTNTETNQLINEGARIFNNHHESHISGADVVVVSSAIPPNNPELLAARRVNIPVLTRAEMLAELMRKKQSIVVSGSHGKTSTSAMIATMLRSAGMDPTVVIGGSLQSISGNATIGHDEWFIAESDESDGSFVQLLPDIGVITNIDREHMNHYGTYANLEQAFIQFANRVPFDGLVIVCIDNRNITNMVTKIQRPVRRYGVDTKADINAMGIRLDQQQVTFDLVRDEHILGSVLLSVHGRHNILNALAAAEAGFAVGLNFDQVRQGLKAYQGVGRRMELKGCAKGVYVYDDYAHHPTEITATLSALRDKLQQQGQGQLYVVFQPHRYTRVGDLWDDFARSFMCASQVVVTPIYAASEPPIAGITHEKLAQAITSACSIETVVIDNLAQSVTHMCQQLEPGDIVVTMGAGDITTVADLLLQQLQSRAVQ